MNYGNYGICLIMGNAGFLSSTVVQHPNFPPSRSLSLNLEDIYRGLKPNNVGT